MLFAPYRRLKGGGYSQVGAGLFSRAASDGTRGHSVKLSHGRFRLDLGVLHKKGDWNGLSREVAESLSLQVFKEGLDVVLSALV